MINSRRSTRLTAQIIRSRVGSRAHRVAELVRRRFDCTGSTTRLRCRAERLKESVLENAIAVAMVMSEKVGWSPPSTFDDWKPYLYVIPYVDFGMRLKPVPRPKRASNEMEYIIEDLKEGEFHILEFPQW